MNPAVRSRSIKRPVGFLFAALLLRAGHAQQVRHVDLRRHVESKETEPHVPELLRPTGCGNKPGGVIADGEMRAKTQRNILVAVTKLSDEQPTVGAEIEAEVMLKNLGPAPIAIPRLTNPTRLEAGENDNYEEWEVGKFIIKLRNKEREMRLRSLSGALYSSPYSNGSTLTLKEGEWLTVELRFKLQAEWPDVEGRVLPGEHQVIAEWRQEMHTQKRIGCRINSGFLPYKGYYRQEHGAATLVALPNR